MISDVEELGTELSIEPFSEVCVLGDREVKVMEPRSRYYVVTPRVAEGQRCVGNESSGVKPSVYCMRACVGVTRSDSGQSVPQPRAAVITAS